jgi:hypothetical protein
MGFPKVANIPFSREHGQKPRRRSGVVYCPLSNNSIRPREHVRWDSQADPLGSFEIDHKLKLHRLLDGQIGRLDAFEKFVDQPGRVATVRR